MLFLNIGIFADDLNKMKHKFDLIVVRIFVGLLASWASNIGLTGYIYFASLC